MHGILATSQLVCLTLCTRCSSKLVEWRRELVLVLLRRLCEHEASWSCRQHMQPG